MQRRTVAGAYHVHTTRSDGAADKAAIAAAAARAGLKFVILTDHGDGTRQPDPPQYIDGVLCIDASRSARTAGTTSRSTCRPRRIRSAGEPSAVVEDVRRLGGFGIVAHPDSPKAQLAWTDWDAPIDGIEWLNADSEWRDESRTRLAPGCCSITSCDPAPALAPMLDRPVRTLERWDELPRHRRSWRSPAHDAHGGIGRGDDEGGNAAFRRSARCPRYEASFRNLQHRVMLERPLIGRRRRRTRAAPVDAMRRDARSRPSTPSRRCVAGLLRLAAPASVAGVVVGSSAPGLPTIARPSRCLRCAAASFARA